MRHHCHNPDYPFVEPPTEFTKETDKQQLQYSLGGVLYMPGTQQIIEKILARRAPSPSMVMCFEDAIREQDLPQAERNVLSHLERLASARERGEITLADIPLIFLRVRDLDHFRTFAGRLSEKLVTVLSGFVFPKFYSNNAVHYMETLSSVCDKFKARLYAMPILEGPSIAFIETRTADLLDLKSRIEPYRHMILNVRVGGTDFSSLFAVRRDINTSIYNIMVVRDCLSDILNVFNRDQDGYVVSAPVWEYFLAYNQDDLARLMAQRDRRALMSRNRILNDAVDGLLRETMMDRVNGFVGKTIIHPSHLRFVNGMQAVTREEYEDAQQILDADGSVVKSRKSNKMNEINPHRSWARRVVRRAWAYGVIEDESNYLELILGGG